jgi:hypothetical protein
MENDEYLALVGQVVTAHRDEIERDLATARRVRGQSELDLADANRQITSFEFLLSLVEGGIPVADERTTLHEAMRKVLESAPGRRMPATELAREINRRALYKMRDGRPVEPQQIHARAGNYGGFNRNDRGIGLD